jgi:hypothetical protein
MSGGGTCSKATRGRVSCDRPQLSLWSDAVHDSSPCVWTRLIARSHARTHAPPNGRTHGRSSGRLG